MAKLEISVLKGVNGARFGFSSTIVHRALGDDYKKEKTREMTQKDKDFLNWVDQQFAEMSGRPIEEFSKYNDDKYDFDDKDKSDYYPFCRIDYDENDKFEAIEIYSDQQTELIIDGKDCSDFELHKLLSLADDFVSEENNTAWTSYSKQIGIWCPDGNSRVECILFGKNGYYDNQMNKSH